MNRTLDRMLCVIFPRRCAACAELILPEDFLCAECAGSLMEQFERGPVLTGAGGIPIVSAAEYTGTAQAVLRKFKFRDVSSLAFGISGFLAECLSAAWPGETFDIIVPVPMSGRDVLRRGYNQSALLAAELSERTGIPAEKRLLRKIRRTKKQHMLTREERGVNLKGAFSVAPGNNDLVEGERILLVDDVTTTGSTLAECAQVLLSAGAKSVRGITFCATPLETPDFDGADSGSVEERETQSGAGFV